MTERGGTKLSYPAEAHVLSAEARTLPQKQHSHYYCEMLYVTKGTASVISGGVKHILAKGSIFFIHSAAEHSITSGLGAKVISVCFDPVYFSQQGVAFSELPHLLKRASLSICAQELFPPGTVSESIAEHCFNDCLAESGRTDYGYDIAVNSCVSRLLVELIRVWEKNGFNTDAENSKKSDIDINSVTAYIVKHCDEQLRVEELAARCGMSYSYFAKKFGELYGQTCKEFIERTRIEKAEKLLLFTDHDLSFISQELGFSDCSHLIKVFKKHKGVTPRQFRIRKGQ